MHAIVILAALANGGEGGTGGEKPKRILPLSVREAVALSLNHNVDLEVARYQPWIEDQNVTQTLGAWDHVAYATASHGESISQPSNSLIDATRPESTTESYSLGVRKALPFGPSYDLSFRTSKLDTNNPFAPFDPRWTQSLNGSVTVPLLRGGWPTVNTATLVIARHGRDMALDDFEQSLSAAVFEVVQAYWDLVFAIEDRKVREQSLEVAVRLLADNQARFERGLVARIDVTEADAGVAAQREGILTAEAAEQNAMDRLKRLIDPGLLRRAVDLAPVEAPRSLESELPEEAAVARLLAEAIARRPEIRRMRRERRRHEVTMSVVGNELLPRVDLTGSASLNGTEDSFSSSGDETRSGDFRDVSVFLSFEWALEGSSARSAARRAELERRRLELMERSLEDQVLVEVREAVRTVKTNEKRIEATERASELAEEQLDGEMRRREQGLSTTFRVLDVQEDLALARTSALKARIDYTMSQHQLDLSAGTLLDRMGIRLKENLEPRLSGRK